MVVWVYSGGGEAEVNGIIPFLQSHFAGCTFERQLPAKTKIPVKRVTATDGPRKSSPLGGTGRYLTTQIRQMITEYGIGDAQAILILDDTDERDPEEQTRQMHDAVREVTDALTEKPLPIIVALAVPELEVWLLADRNNTIGSDYKTCFYAVTRQLVQNGIDWARPESFPCRDQTGHYQKLSTLLQDAIQQHCAERFSKARDTPRLLRQIDPQTVSRCCPYFRAFWSQLKALCITPNV